MSTGKFQVIWFFLWWPPLELKIKGEKHILCQLQIAHNCLFLFVLTFLIKLNFAVSSMFQFFLCVCVIDKFSNNPITKKQNTNTNTYCFTDCYYLFSNFTYKWFLISKYAQLPQQYILYPSWFIYLLPILHVSCIFNKSAVITVKFVTISIQ